MYQGLENASRAPFVVLMCCMVVVVQPIRMHRYAFAYINISRNNLNKE